MAYAWSEQETMASYSMTGQARECPSYRDLDLRGRGRVEIAAGSESGGSAHEDKHAVLRFALGTRKWQSVIGVALCKLASVHL